MEMMMYGATGFLICALGFLFIVTVASLVIKRTRGRPAYRNLGATPAEFVRNPMEKMMAKPDDKEKLIQ
jgi:hypothetical protein